MLLFGVRAGARELPSQRTRTHTTHTQNAVFFSCAESRLLHGCCTVQTAVARLGNKSCLKALKSDEHLSSTRLILEKAAF